MPQINFKFVSYLFRHGKISVHFGHKWRISAPGIVINNHVDPHKGGFGIVNYNPRHTDCPLVTKQYAFSTTFGSPQICMLFSYEHPEMWFAHKCNRFSNLVVIPSLLISFSLKLKESKTMREFCVSFWTFKRNSAPIKNDIARTVNGFKISYVLLPITETFPLLGNTHKLSWHKFCLFWLPCWQTLTFGIWWLLVLL